MTGTHAISDWEARFRDLAGRCVPADDVRFDALSPMFRAWRRGLRPPGAAPKSPDQMLWWCAAGGGAPVDEVLARCAGDPCARRDADRGALLPMSACEAIEVWTESEFSALHALTWIALRSGRADLEARVRDVARFHIGSTQPDNATNRPWAAHVFAALAAEGDSEADLYAQTLLHNTMVCATGDPLVREILADASDVLAGRDRPGVSPPGPGG